MPPVLEKGVDLYRSITFSCAFDLVHPTRCVFLPTVEGSQLLDVFITLRGARNPYVTVAGHPFSAAHEVRVQLRRDLKGTSQTTDLTPDFLSALQAELDRLPADQLASAYQAGIADWFGVVERHLSQNYSSEVISRDKARASQLVQVRPCSKWLSTLGHQSEGSQGSLHVFNYLFEWLPLRPISLAGVLERHSKRVGGQAISLDSSTLPRLVFASGLAPLPAGSTQAAPIGGAVEGVLECAFGNELAKEFSDMRDKVRRDLVDIRSRLRNTGPLMQTVMTLGDRVARILEELSEAEASLADQKLQLSAIRQDVAAARGKVDQLA